MGARPPRRAAAQATLAAIALALAPQPDEVLELTDPVKFGTWLAQEYARDRGFYFRLLSDLERDQSPATQEALAIAGRIIAGSQPAPTPTPLPGGNLAHTLAAGDHQRRHTLGVQRKHILLEGHRFRAYGSGIDTGDTISGGRPAPAPPPEPEDGRRSTRRRRRRSQ